MYMNYNYNYHVLHNTDTFQSMLAIKPKHVGIAGI